MPDIMESLRECVLAFLSLHQVHYSTPEKLQPHYFSVTSDTSGSSVIPFLNINQWEETHCVCM